MRLKSLAAFKLFSKVLFLTFFLFVSLLHHISIVGPREKNVFHKKILDKADKWGTRKFKLEHLDKTEDTSVPQFPASLHYKYYDCTQYRFW